ncbi:MAG TPA: hypothetical protein VE954_36385 [Oligoflexus sp.]|uniref:hypothetical protein n=1 Tax=Oligoflexus sp. TaxID=1971216 RepID=UPI002D421631|nr:hypothetical protein [Oligoflexus sp.]HYX38614.1 hypothetical protein [Oligoflexus sp.]
MKTYLSLSLLSLLLACGETRIKSVDDEVMEEAQTDKATAALKREEAALLGTWQACSPTSETESKGHEYIFTGDGGVMLVQRQYSNPNCADQPTEEENLTAKWKLAPVKESSDFTLHFTWDESKKLESQYRFKSGTVELPKIFELKEKPDLALAQLADKDNFLTLKKVPVDSGEEQRRQSELMVISFAKSLLRRDGIWQTACAESKHSIVQFEVGKNISMTRSLVTYEDEKCEKLKDTQKDEKATEITLSAVSDLAQKKIALEMGKDKQKATLKVFFDNIDKLELTESKDNKNVSATYGFKASGDEP